MICFIQNRPALQIANHQVFDYDTAWLDTALERAARAADVENFPFVADIRSGVVRYLETRCPLQLMPIADLYDRMRRMLIKIGCQHIADQLRPLAPPVTVCLHKAAQEAGPGFELGFFESLRRELIRLRAAGVEEIRFAGLHAGAMVLCGVEVWDPCCARLQHEMEAFLDDWKSPGHDAGCAVAGG
jgi:hypothetical protein